MHHGRFMTYAVAVYVRHMPVIFLCLISIG